MDVWAVWILILTTLGGVVLGIVASSLIQVRIVHPSAGGLLGLPARVVIAGLPEGASVGVRLRDGHGLVLAEKAFVSRAGIAEGLLYFEPPTADEGILEAFAIPSGEVLARRPVRFPRERGRWVKVFFWNRKGELFPAIRRVPGVPGIATEALRALLAGPTLPEARDYIWSAAPMGVQLVTLEISGGKAVAVLAVPDPDAPSLAPFSLQVKRTLREFPTVKEAEIRYVALP